MSSIYTNLLFMHGHITDLELARRLADTPAADSRPTGKRQLTPGAMANGGSGKAGATAVRNQGVIVTALRWATAR